MRTCLILSLFLVFMWGCHTDDRPAKLIPQNDYTHLMIEMQLLQAYQKRERPDSTKVDSLRQAIFKKYGVSPQQFYKSHTYYQQNIEEESDRIKNAIEELRKDHISRPDSMARPDSISTP